MPEEKKAGSRSTVVKKLKATKTVSVYQKEWFFSMKDRVEKEKCDFAILNADVPMEIFRAMDIPFVVNQWWAAICGAKRMTRKYFGLMQENGYRPLEGPELREMFRDRTGEQSFEGFLRAFCARKYDSDFSREMSRSVAAYLEEYRGEGRA